jgi:uncharacterized protein (TIGR00645 family)
MFIKVLGFQFPYIHRNYLQDILLYGRYLLYPMYAVLLYGICLISIDFVKDVFGYPIDLNAHIMQILGWLDIAMVANLVWYVSAGSYYVFVHEYEGEHLNMHNKPRVLLHLSSGLLKEKMAGSLIGVSSVHLLQYFLSLGKNDWNWPEIAAMGFIHVLFIVGLVAFNHTNKE